MSRTGNRILQKLDFRLCLALPLFEIPGTYQHLETRYIPKEISAEIKNIQYGLPVQIVPSPTMQEDTSNPGSSIITNETNLLTRVRSDSGTINSNCRRLKYARTMQQMHKTSRLHFANNGWTQANPASAMPKL